MSAIIRWTEGDPYPENWPKWLRDADIEWCYVSIDDTGSVIWHDGIWHCGTWHAGVWHHGTWHAGIWRGGTWRGGIWHDGIWHCGIWHGGVWRGGKWLGGDWGRRDGGWRGYSVSWPGHGDRGRTLRLLKHDDGREQFNCSCFWGTRQDLLNYIRNFDPALAPSRLFAINLIDQMIAREK